MAGLIGEVSFKSLGAGGLIENIRPKLLGAKCLIGEVSLGLLGGSLLGQSLQLAFHLTANS